MSLYRYLVHVLTNENGDPDPEPVLQVAGEWHEKGLVHVLTDENGDPDPEPVLQVAGERHEEALAKGGQRGDPHRVRVVLLSLHIHLLILFSHFLS